MSKKHVMEENMDLIKAMIKDNRPKFEIARKIELNYDTFNKYLKEFGIDYGGNPSRKGIEHSEIKIPLEKIISNEVPYSTSSLKRRLIKEGIKEEKCEECGLTFWRGQKINFELHHVDGNRYNNSLDNLKLLCPNCHSQTEGFRSHK
jgi:Zn finger protein HypA/HybF involved in hydrogenase expression